MSRLLLAKIRSRFGQYRRQGCNRSARIVTDSAVLHALRFVFGFAPWHARSPISARPYRKGVAAMISALHPDCVVEVGCGLGGIIAAVRAPRRAGYDVDRGAVRAARFLHRSVDFREGSFDNLVEREIDVLAAICWLHEFSPEQVEQWLLPLLDRTRYLLLDATDPASPLNFAFNHDYAFLKDKARLVRSEKFEEQFRTFVLFEVIP